MNDLGIILISSFAHLGTNIFMLEIYVAAVIYYLKDILDA